MKHRRNLIVGIVLTVAAATALLTTVSAPGHETTATENGSSAPTAVSPAPAADNTEAISPGDCAYQWAYQPAIDLTRSFDTALKTLNPQANGRVEYFGEDCLRADGSRTFLTMETDFYVRLLVEDLSQEEEFGNWVAQVMEIVSQLPREELPGRYGFVEFLFERNEKERIVFRVPIQQYLDEAGGKSGSDLLQMFYTSP